VRSADIPRSPLFRAFGRDFSDRQRRGVASKDTLLAVGRVYSGSASIGRSATSLSLCTGVQEGEQILLDLEILDDGFDDEICLLDSLSSTQRSQYDSLAKGRYMETSELTGLWQWRSVTRPALSILLRSSLPWVQPSWPPGLKIC